MKSLHLIKSIFISPIFGILYLLFFFSCSNSHSPSTPGNKPQSNTDTLIIPERFNLEIQPNHSIKCELISDRHKDHYIVNKLFVLDNEYIFNSIADSSHFRPKRLWPYLKSR